MNWEIKPDLQNNYKTALRNAVRDSSKFNEFRKDVSIRVVVEGVSLHTAKAYYEKLLSRDKGWVDSNWSEIERNDRIGNPTRQIFDSKRLKVATATVRYAWNTWDISRRFDLLDKKVVEVGVGYGGLARLICHICKPAEYVLVDIPEALELARIYLGKFDIGSKLTFLTPEQAIPGDVFIANYSIAELDANSQRAYFDSVISKSRSGYLTHNIPKPSGNQLSRDEFEVRLKRSFDVEQYEESVPKCEKSVVYVCKEKKTST